MTPDNLLNWYEASLPTKERKSRGHFSTPPQLIEDMLDACGYTPDQDLSRLRVLDPACGSGNFLTGATKRLIAFGQQAKHSAQVIATSIQRNIWGFDPDPVSCFLAEMHLHAICTQNISPSEREQAPSLHIHQADALTLRWDEKANVDLFLANPPYLAAKNNDLSGYRTMQGSGQIDSYLLFVQLALRITKPYGWIGLVLPDPLLARANAHQIRQSLLAETTIHHLWHLAGVFSAGVGAVVIVAQKCTPKKLHTICWQREHWSTFLARRLHQASPIFDGNVPHPTKVSTPGYVTQAMLLNQPHAELRYLLNEVRGTLVEHLHNQFQTSNGRLHLRPLDDFVIIRRGEEIGKDHPWLKKVLTPDDLVSQPDTTLPHWHPVLRGGVDIKPYSPPVAQCWIPHVAIRKSLERYFTPKLLIIKSVGRLQATLDLHNHVVLQTLYMLHLRPQPSTLEKQATHAMIQPQQEDELYFLLALLNSRLLQEYVYILHTAYKWVQPQIEQHVLTQLPIPIHVNAAEKTRIIRQARLLMDACNEKKAAEDLKKQYNKLYEEQEQAICALYTSALAVEMHSV
jgi:hypothetical protein